MKQIELEVLKTLKSDIGFIMERIMELDKYLQNTVQLLNERDHLVSAAYHVSSIYSCFEEIFVTVTMRFLSMTRDPRIPKSSSGGVISSFETAFAVMFRVV